MACMAWQQAAGTGPHQVRRRSAAAALLAAGLGAVLPGPAQAATVLRVLAWPGYADADFVAVFEKRHGVKVEITTVASDDVLRAKLIEAQVAAEAAGDTAREDAIWAELRASTERRKLSVSLV